MTETPTRSTLKFIAVDGEGDDREQFELDGKLVTQQWYTVMTSSLGVQTALVHEIDGLRQRLTSYECMHWLCDLGKHNPGAVFVGYGLSYDINMMLRDLPFTTLSFIRDQNSPLTAQNNTTYNGIRAGAFRIRWVNRKYLKISRYAFNIVNGRIQYVKDKRGRNLIDCSVKIYDTLGFFQGTFVKAIEQYGLPVEDIDFIKSMKSERGNFSEHSTEEIIRYSTRECKILVDLIKLVDHYLRHPELDIQLKRFDGAGAIAAALLEMFGVKDHIEQPPHNVLLAALHAYSGGRIELIRWGHYTGTVYDQDVNSCYPTGMLPLPSLTGGTWIHWTGKIPFNNPFFIARVKWNLTDANRRIYPFPYREENDNIIYPAQGESWVWGYELYKALKWQYKYQGGSIEVIEAYWFEPANAQAKPFKFIKGLARQRLAWKKEHKATGGASGGQHLTVKLGLNSLYGKTAQQIGGAVQLDGSIKLPPFHSILYAGAITSYARATLYDLAMENEDAVIMFATDGLFTTEPMNVDQGDGLGQWEVTTCEEMVIVQSGVYYTRTGDTWHKKTRGFDPKTLDQDVVLTHWRAGNAWVDVKTKHFITFGMIATASKPETIVKSMNRFCTWEVATRRIQLSSFGTKRYNLANDEYTTKRNPANGLMATYPKVNDTPDKLSKIYEYVYLKPFDQLTDDQKDYILEREGIEDIDD